MRRRTFLTTAAGPLLAPPAPAAQRGIRLGYDTYSVRAFRWKALEHLEYARRQGLDAIQLSSLDDFESLDAAHLAQVRDAAARHGILIDGGIGCICPTSKSFNAKQGGAAAYMTKGLEVAHAIGARAMRCFMGSAADRQGPGGIERHM